MQTSQNIRNARLSTSSYSSATATTNSVLNGLIPSKRFPNIIPSLTSNQNQIRRLTNFKNPLKRSDQIVDIILSISLTILFACLFIITIEFSTILVKDQKEYMKFNLTEIPNNQTKLKRKDIYPINSFFACVWFFNFLLFIICLFIHIFIYKRRAQRNRARAAFLREFGRIFENGTCSSRDLLIDYLLKICLLCILWYLSCYLIFRSMSILISSQIIILYSITITLREVLGWIFLHEQFIGNKIIAHILSLSSLLFLAHDDRFRFNRFLLGLTMVTCSVALKTIFDVLIHGFIKDLTNSKMRILMINVCLCGTCLLWPFIFIFHLTKIEIIPNMNNYSFIFLITLICGLLFNVLKITIPMKYTSISNVASLLLVIPSTSLIDRYLFGIKYSSLVLLSIFCSLFGILLSMIPKQWFQPGEATKMKQALGLMNKDSNLNNNLGTLTTGGTTTGTSSAFEEIRAQRRIRNAFLYNDIKT